MSRKTRVITLSALFAALSVISLYVASIWPTGRFGLVAFSSLFVAAAVCETGLVSGLYVFIITSALGMLILPDKSAPLLYTLFFGYYPVVKSLVERIRSRVAQWILKLLVFNASLLVIWFFFRTLVFGVDFETVTVLLVYIGCNIIFVIFDYGFSKVIGFYLDRISGRTGNRPQR